jgi:hypothetical protein
MTDAISMHFTVRGVRTSSASVFGRECRDLKRVAEVGTVAALQQATGDRSRIADPPSPRDGVRPCATARVGKLTTGGRRQIGYTLPASPMP